MIKVTPYPFSMSISEQDIDELQRRPAELNGVWTKDTWGPQITPNRVRSTVSLFSSKPPISVSDFFTEDRVGAESMMLAPKGETIRLARRLLPPDSTRPLLTFRVCLHPPEPGSGECKIDAVALRYRYDSETILRNDGSGVFNGSNIEKYAQTCLHLASDQEFDDIVEIMGIYETKVSQSYRHVTNPGGVTHTLDTQDPPGRYRLSWTDAVWTEATNLTWRQACLAHKQLQDEGRCGCGELAQMITTTAIMESTTYDADRYT